MKLMTPERRRLLPAAILATLLFHIFWLWVFARFVHRDAQYRALAPEYYDVQVVSAADFRLLANPSKRKVTLSDGTSFEKSAIWEEVVLPNFKSTNGGQLYVRVTTKGTGHLLSYIEPNYILIGFFAAAGLAASLWNLTAGGTNGTEAVTPAANVHQPDSVT